MKYFSRNSFFSLLLCIISLSFINVSADSEHLDMKYLASSVSISNIFQKLNLTEKNIPKLSLKALSRAKSFVTKSVSEKDKYKKEEEPITCSYDDQLIHAKVTALENMLRDPNAKSFGEEFVYMYLSHYLDIPPDFLESCSKSDEEPYLANLITIDDRNTYNSFLNAIHKIEILEKFRNMFSEITDTVSKFESFEKAFLEKNYADLVHDQIDSLLKKGRYIIISGKSPKEIIEQEIQEIIEKFETTDSPEEKIIKEVRESLGREVLSQDIVDSLFDTINVVFEIEAGSANIFTAAVTMINMPLLIYTTLAPKATLSGMLYTLSMRVAGRTMRYLEYENGI